MRRRIRNILILMIVCILGIYLFQGYWLYNSYKVQFDQFNRDINGSLRTALFNNQFMDVRRLIHYYGKDPLPVMDRYHKDTAANPSNELVIQLEQMGIPDNKKDSAQALIDSIMNGDREMPFYKHGSPSRTFADTLARQISDLILLSTTI